MPAEWYETPVFYFSNPAAIFGPDEDVPYPDGTEELDYELECAAVIGAEGRIGGFTILNDWSARDLQRQEMRVGLGPAKGKDFATSLGPGARHARRVRRQHGGDGGARQRRGALARQPQRDCTTRWDALLAQAARNTILRPGDVIGSGTVGSGCILEHGDGRWLQRGDVVELEIEGIGVLRNRSRDLRRRRPRGGAPARRRRAPHARRSRSRTLGEHVVLKPECLQRAGAFKFRGAYNKIASLPTGTPVLAYSSGNHAQAVALAARLLGSQATILMPEDAPQLEARRDARLRRRDRRLRPLPRRPRRARRASSRASAASSSCARTTTRS